MAWALYSVLRNRFWAAVFLNVVSTGLVLSGPILLREIVVFVEDSQDTESPPNGNRGLFLVLILALILFGDALAKVRVSLRVRLRVRLSVKVIVRSRVCG